MNAIDTMETALKIKAVAVILIDDRALGLTEDEFRGMGLILYDIANELAEADSVHTKSAKSKGGSS